MKSVLAVGAAFLIVACNMPGTSAKTTPTASAAVTPLAVPSGKLDAEVAMPPGFPSDVPIYTGARLTAAAPFSGQGQATWGMVWETLDGADKVKQFYTTKLNQGDWTTSTASPSPSPSGGAFTINFSRKSNPHYTGTLGIDGSSGVTKISMALVSPGS